MKSFCFNFYFRCCVCIYIFISHDGISFFYIFFAMPLTLNAWEDVKVYPLVTELFIYLLLALSLWHACLALRSNSRAAGRGTRPITVWLSLVLLAATWELFCHSEAPKWHPICYPKSLVMFRNCHSLWGMLRHVPCKSVSQSVTQSVEWRARDALCSHATI
jgi:hypothetical protein